MLQNNWLEYMEIQKNRIYLLSTVHYAKAYIM